MEKSQELFEAHRKNSFLDNKNREANTRHLNGQDGLHLGLISSNVGLLGLPAQKQGL